MGNKASVGNSGATTTAEAEGMNTSHNSSPSMLPESARVMYENMSNAYGKRTVVQNNSNDMNKKQRIEEAATPPKIEESRRRRKLRKEKRRQQRQQYYDQHHHQSMREVNAAPHPSLPPSLAFPSMMEMIQNEISEAQSLQVSTSSSSSPQSAFSNMNALSSFLTRMTDCSDTPLSILSDGDHPHGPTTTSSPQSTASNNLLASMTSKYKAAMYKAAIKDNLSDELFEDEPDCTMTDSRFPPLRGPPEIHLVMSLREEDGTEATEIIHSTSMTH